MAEHAKLLLIHGIFSARSAWGGVRARLGTEVETCAPDVLGYGRARCDGEYTLARAVEHLRELAERERPTHVVGHSMGGVLALALAARLPGAFARVGVIGLPVYSGRNEAMAFLRQRRRNRLFLRHDSLTHAGCAALRRTRPAWAPFVPLFLGRAGASALVDAFDHCRESHCRGLEQVVFGGQVEALAVAVQTPVAALHGGRDHAAPLAPVQRLAALHGWDLTVVPTAGHQAIVYRPGAVAAWLRENVLGSPGEPA